MFSHLLNLFSPSGRWHLKPRRFPKDSENNYTSKVLLPHYILKDLVDCNFQPPYVFEIYHEGGVYKTACSVLDFQLEENDIFVPSWMFEQLSLDDCDEVFIKPIKSVKGSGIKLLPHSVDFLSIESPKKELEENLKNYHVLSYGDEILLNFEDIGRCRFTVTKIFPETEDTIYIVDTDLNVDFDEPLGYQEKLESEKSVLKYVHVHQEDDYKVIRFDKTGLLFDWDALNSLASEIA